MNEIHADAIETRLGDDIEIQFTVRDRNGNLVSLAGATATFRVSKEDSSNSLLEKTETDGITILGSNATVTMNTDELDTADDYMFQLRITKSGKTMVSAEGELIVKPLIE